MDTLFFIAAKLIWGLIRPETWLFIALVIAWRALKRGRTGLARRLLAATLVCAITLAVLPLGDLLLRPLEGSFPVPTQLSRVDGIIVLGGAEDMSRTAHWQEPQLNDAAERMTVATELARRFPDARLLFSGGSGALSDLACTDCAGAHVAGAFFADQGIEASRLVLEPDSRNTWENARNSFALAAPAPDEVWVLVTSAFHMPRALESFQRAGWEVVPYPVDYRTAGFWDGIGWNFAGNLDTLNTALKEYVGVMAYRLLVFPRQEDQL